MHDTNRATLRLPRALRDAVEKIGKKNERSINGQITHYVRRGLAEDRAAPKEEGGAE